MILFEQAPTTQEVYDLLRSKQATNEELNAMTLLIQRTVVEVRPDAKLILTTDKQGRVTHAGIYDAPLTLNERGQFRPIQQNAPQLVSKRVECKRLLFESLRLQIEFDLWVDALFHTARETPALACKVRGVIAQYYQHPQNTTHLH